MKLWLLDADVIIDLLSAGIFDDLVERHEVYTATIVIGEVKSFYSSGEKKLINFRTLYVDNGKVKELTAYYSQGLYLVLKGSPLFKEEIEAWTYGPVVRELYFVYNQHGASGIPADESFDPKSIDTSTREFLDEVYTVFGQFSAVRLKDLTHTDQCWIDALPDKIIPHKSMRDALKKYIKDGEDE